MQYINVLTDANGSCRIFYVFFLVFATSYKKNLREDYVVQKYTKGSKMIDEITG